MATHQDLADFLNEPDGWNKLLGDDWYLDNYDHERWEQALPCDDRDVYQATEPTKKLTNDFEVDLSYQGDEDPRPESKRLLPIFRKWLANRDATSFSVLIPVKGFLAVDLLKLLPPGSKVR